MASNTNTLKPPTNKKKIKNKKNKKKEINPSI